MAASVDELVPVGFKFDPKDEELVAHYLLPRLRGQRLPCEGIIVEADPLSAPPWKLLEEHRRGNDGFFFAAGKARSSKDARQQRTCDGGGCWKGQKRKKSDGVGDGEKLVVPGTGEVIGWRKYLLNFHADGEGGSSGWVMHEFAVTAPSDLASSSSVMAYHIRFTGHGKNSKKRNREEDSVAGDEASRPQPVPPRVVQVPEATPSEQGQASSWVMDSAAAFEDSTHEEPLFFSGDLTSFSLPAETSAPSFDVEIDELIRFIDENQM